jgi:hypothetical protein
MRYVLAAAIVVMLPALAPGQQTQAQNPPPSIGLPLPPIGLPLPPIGLDTSVNRQPIAPAQPPSDGGPHRPHPAIIFFGAPYAFGVDPALQSKTPGVIAPSPADSTPPPPPTGTLRLEIDPVELAQVFVGGEYVGTPTDLDGQLELEPGTHRIEIRARGFETLAFDARVVADRTITFRETLTRVGEPGGAGKASEPGDSARKEPRPSQPTNPTSLTSPTRPKSTFYLIPGCYLGNVHPDEVKLPANCDFSKMITHTPRS